MPLSSVYLLLADFYQCICVVKPFSCKETLDNGNGIPGAENAFSPTSRAYTTVERVKILAQIF
jgi:hypothetical protein